MNLIYPRFYLGRSLLAEDGFIVASIDDAELVNFRRIFDEVFGEENYIATLVYDRNRKNDAKLFSVGHEYMLVYARNKSLLRETDVVLRAPKEGIQEARQLFDSLVVKHGSNFEKIQEEWRSHFAGLEAEHEHKPLGRFSKIQSTRGPFRDDGDISWPGGKGPDYEVLHPKTLKPCKTPKGGWVYPTKASFDEAVRKGRVVFGPDESTLPRQMRYLFESVGEVMRSVMFSYAQTATVELSKLMGGRVFENPKNYKDLQALVSYMTAPGDLVLDFFAGSGSLGHAVLGCNDTGQGNRRFMLVQLPEPTEMEQYPTIASLTRDRIRRAGRQISEGHTGLPFSEADLGFRAFSLAPSSFIPWDGTASNDADQLAKQLQLGIINTRDDRRPEDLLYEVLLKSWGEPALSLKVGLEIIEGVGVFSIAEGAFLICLEEQVTLEFIRCVASRKPDRVVMLESAFVGNDQLKTNAVQTFKTAGVTSFKVV